MNARRAIFLTCLGLASIPIYALNFRFAEILQKVNLISSKGAPFVSFLYQMLVLWVIYLIAAGTVLRSEAADRNNAAIFIILFFAILYRLLLVPTQPVLSTDIYRYIWDGRVQAHGINPYQYSPDDKALSNLQDEAIYSHMNLQ